MKRVYVVWYRSGTIPCKLHVLAHRMTDVEVYTQNLTVLAIRLAQDQRHWDVEL